MLPLLCVGLSHHTAPVALRERFALGPEAQRDLLERLLPRHSPRDRFAELAVLSTCNRTELYARVASRYRDTAAIEGLVEFLASCAPEGAQAFEPCVYRHTGVHVVRHLCRVAAGLESMVVGEFEILGQVAAAQALAVEHATAGPVLGEAFRAALRAGRRARAETVVARLPTSVGSEAVRLLADLVGPLSARCVLLVGTGKMGRVAADALRGQGVEQLTVVSRTARHADAFAQRVDARALPWHDLADAIGAADAVLCSTGAPHAVITRELVERAIGAGGDGRRRVFVDIAMPRDVEPTVADVPGTEVHDLDTLSARLQGNQRLRQGAVPAAERIVEEEVAHFVAWRRATELRPLLAQMHARAESIRQQEVQRLLRRVGDLSPEVRAQLETFSQSLVNKVLDEPTRRLRAATDPDQAQVYATVARVLFGLEDADPAAGGSAA